MRPQMPRLALPTPTSCLVLSARPNFLLQTIQYCQRPAALMPSNCLDGQAWTFSKTSSRDGLSFFSLKNPYFPQCKYGRKGGDSCFPRGLRGSKASPLDSRVGNPIRNRGGSRSNCQERPGYPHWRSPQSDLGTRPFPSIRKGRLPTTQGPAGFHPGGALPFGTYSPNRTTIRFL